MNEVCYREMFTVSKLDAVLFSTFSSGVGIGTYMYLSCITSFLKEIYGYTR